MTRVVYRVFFDSDYCRAIVRRYYAQRPFLARPEGQFAILLVVLLGVWWFSQSAGVSTNAAIKALAWGIPCALAGSFLTRFAVALKLQRKSEFGTGITMTLTDEGVEGSGPNVSGKWSWKGYPHSVRFSDGILLQRPGVIRWLPDSAIEIGTPQEATTLVSAKSSLRKLDL